MFRKTKLVFAGILALSLMVSSAGAALASGSAWLFPVDATTTSLLAQADTNGDRKITIDDMLTKPVVLTDTFGRQHTFTDLYLLSVLLQELAEAHDAGAKVLALRPQRLKESVVDRTSRLIREQFWNGLTRRFDAAGLASMAADLKSASTDGRFHLYVPSDDGYALSYFRGIAHAEPAMKLMVEELPPVVDGDFVRRLDGKHGLLALKIAPGRDHKPDGVPFVVPGGRFNEMYGWDSYFIVLGLLQDGRLDLARAIVDNEVYEVLHYGKVLNANRTYYLTRSQPPFLSSMLRAVYAKLPKSEANKAWLATGLTAVIHEYKSVWTVAPRLDPSSGLSRYYDDGHGPCPEVEKGHYDRILAPYAKDKRLTVESYLQAYVLGTYREPTLEAFFLNDRAVRESGHDTTYRFAMRTAEFLPVDLNSLLYRLERDVGELLSQEFGGGFPPEKGLDAAELRPATWFLRAEARSQAITTWLWDAKAGQFFDYDLSLHRRSGYVSATTFYPLWAGLATKDQASSVVRSALPQLKKKAGLAATAEASRGPMTSGRMERQWDYPYGWAPHQMLAWEGLKAYGYQAEASDLTYRWLYAIAKNAHDFNGMVPEKINVETGSPRVTAEYGNVGTDFSFRPKEGFGWMNASFQVGLASLSAESRERLRQLAAP